MDILGQSAIEFAPWAVENASSFVPSFPYSPDAELGESPTSTDDYPPLDGGRLGWSPYDTTSQSPVLSAIPYFTGDGFLQPMEADSDSGDLSPIDSRRPTMPEVDAAAARWSWSQPSSPSIGPESLPSSFNTRSRYGPKAAAAPSASKTKPTPKLRTASRTARKKKAARSKDAASPQDAESITTDEIATPEELRARRNHNLVEKQYRNRLNAQFERLLTVLPTNQQRWQPGGCGGGGGSSSGDGGSPGSDDIMKRMSKAEVLDMATRRIKELEMDRQRLQRERKELLRNVEMMSGVLPRGIAR